MNAYSTGQQKPQNTQHHGSTEDHVRWHKTGKTKAVIEYGVHKGYKKILVLYIRSGKESKSYKSDWKMHQYHPGNDEDEKNGEYVFSKLLHKNSLKAAEKFSHEEPNKDLQRWAALHLFSACLVEEAFELSAAYLFLNPLPFDAHCSRVIGFFKTHAVLLSHYD
ncbi:hypothetical protein KIW84_031344 [Lathyrus oleraceus]|uniref:NAC domain-containing protein n=1 Tax=Pisum sativum TaxID=3888 RepID=A0A9D4XS22_PEA|nr:hypothetical protein KIW84_031344 [Pisum sativum]